MPPRPAIYQLQVSIKYITKAQDLSEIHRAPQSPCNPFCAAPSSPGIKPKQCTWHQPWAAAHPSPSTPWLSNSTLSPDPPVTIWPSPKAACSFDSSAQPRPALTYIHAASTLTSAVTDTQRVTHSLGRQGKYVWQIVRQSPMEIDWWDAPLVLRDSAEAIHMILTMGGSPSCFHGGSLAVRFLL